MSSTYSPPGRIGNPSLSLGTDPRALPALVEVAKAMGLDALATAPYPDLDDMAALEATMRQSSEGFTAVYESLPNELPGDENEPEVEESIITIEGVDGNEIKLYVFKRKDAGSEPLPAVVYIHGGGMTILTPTLKPCVRWCKSLALLNTISIAVDFRNAWQPDGSHAPFPAGLNDCVSAIKYLATHKSSLGISHLILQGESGGANLCLATALSLKNQNLIAGVYACAPYISAAYAWPSETKLSTLPSLIENDGFFLAVPSMAGMAQYYSPDPSDQTNPLAWPYHASEEDLKGLPPHVVVSDELDPLRDEGMAYFRKLVRAGVKASAEMNLGTVHASAIIFRQALPEVHAKELRGIVGFARSLGPF